MANSRTPAGTSAATAAPAPARLSVRERLLASADELFYREGINNVGIDRVLEHAGVAKASLYSTFGSKDELVRAYLEGRQQSRRVRIEERIARHKTPRDQLLAIFDAMAETLARPGFRGCAFVMASAELPGGRGAQEVVAAYRAWVRELLLRLCKEAGARQPRLLAQQLGLLYDGSLVAGQLDGDPAVVATARQTAALLLDAAVAPARRAA
ncbi:MULTISPECIES: TetR/AcrR family transcriptional regulator [Ramlibacter]|uniref:TetR/AcrR family transcriptional regulator n=1 Tax=Ramlibacter TaxID=174951 RepID=UPI0015EEE103|nr:MULTISPECIES: TetR/AcrR family transcriptional regulator [Ramlibacter]MBA2961648.1 TetR/AcrR family transcriptional regulator [Ramlibacter sp. CGMCC 1.13660]